MDFAGRYSVTASIGKGGMGAVYRATDVRLKREVAIKILPQEFAGDAERLASPAGRQAFGETTAQAIRVFFARHRAAE